jgi:hypothetical protein
MQHNSWQRFGLLGLILFPLFSASVATCDDCDDVSLIQLTQKVHAAHAAKQAKRGKQSPGEILLANAVGETFTNGTNVEALSSSNSENTSISITVPIPIWNNETVTSNATLPALIPPSLVPVPYGAYGSLGNNQIFDDSTVAAINNAVSAGVQAAMSNFPAVIGTVNGSSTDSTETLSTGSSLDTPEEVKQAIKSAAAELEATDGWKDLKDEEKEQAIMKAAGDLAVKHADKFASQADKAKDKEVELADHVPDDEELDDDFKDLADLKKEYQKKVQAKIDKIEQKQKGFRQSWPALRHFEK